MSTTLPVQLTRFIGRERELETLRRLLTETRLLTLTGAGGSGKTRLALATAALARDGGTDVAWVELGRIGSGSELTSHVAVALGARMEGGSAPERAIAATLQEREVLLVLDNCEHVVDECAALVDGLLRACPPLRVLATSREALGVGGERSWLVPPLSASEAVGLFVDRAREVASTFALTEASSGAVANICHRLDALPLAIELAAARVGVLTPAQIAERLDDRFGLLTSGARSALPRHRTLRAAVDWSYGLLPEPSRVLLERLSVFEGSFTLDAAEQVGVGGTISPREVLDLLGSLTTRSLVSMHEDHGQARYRLLQTIREYAREKLVERGAAATTAERHARHYLAAARAAAPALLLAREEQLHQMDLAHDDLRAALEWSAESEAGADVGLPLCWSLMWYWFHRQLFREGFGQFERALETAHDPSPEHRAAALHGLGLFGLYAGDPRSGERLSGAEAIWREQGNMRWLAFTLLVRTVEASLRGVPSIARRLADEAVTVATTLDEPWVRALTLAHALVPVLIWEAEWEAAAGALRDAEAIYRDHDYRVGVAYVLDARAFVALNLGDPGAAEALAHASLRLDPARENRWLAGRSLRTLGALALGKGETHRAAKLFGSAEGMYQAIGASSLTAERGAVNELPERLRELMSEDDFARAWACGLSMPYADAVTFALEGGAASGDAAPALGGPIGTVPAAPTLVVESLGTLSVRVLGAPVPSEAWGYAKPRELLLHLLAHPEGRTREQIGLDFWPEASAAQVKNNFHVTLHHARKALGRASLIRYEQGRYRVAVEEGVDFDAARFEKGAEAALRQLRRAPEDAASAASLEEVLALHRGPFLETEPAGDWHVAIRDRLSRLYEEGLLALGAFHAARKQHAQAAEAYGRLVAADALHEAAVRGLVRALAGHGSRREALRAYDRLERDLAAELDAEPEPETVELAARIRRGDVP